MIIGTGLVARALGQKKWDEKYLFFASGVSNSKEPSNHQYHREITLVKETLNNYPNLIFVYFSSTSIYDQHAKESKYVLHKLNVEQIVSKSALDYRIIRISNLVGNGANKSTVLEFLTKSIRTGTSFNLWGNLKRNLIDVDDFTNILKLQLDNSSEQKLLHAFNKHSISVIDMVSCIEEFLLTTSIHSKHAKASKLENHLRLPKIEAIETYGKFIDPTQYLMNLLKKYYDEY